MAWQAPESRYDDFMKDSTDLNTEEIKQKLDEWVASPEHIVHLKKAMEDVEATIKELRRAAVIDPCDLHKPMTI